MPWTPLRVGVGGGGLSYKVGGGGGGGLSYKVHLRWSHVQLSTPSSRMLTDGKVSGLLMNQITDGTITKQST